MWYKSGDKLEFKSQSIAANEIEFVLPKRSSHVHIQIDKIMIRSIEFRGKDLSQWGKPEKKTLSATKSTLSISRAAALAPMSQQGNNFLNVFQRKNFIISRCQNSAVQSFYGTGVYWHRRMMKFSAKFARALLFIRKFSLTYALCATIFHSLNPDAYKFWYESIFTLAHTDKLRNTNMYKQLTSVHSRNVIIYVLWLFSLCWVWTE